MGKVFGIIALLCGILGFVGWMLLGSLPFGFFYLPIAAIVFGIIGLIVDDSKGMSIAGLILGILSIVFIVFILPMLAFLLILFGLSAIF
ncbi:MAG: hypothetical protein KGD72_04495 [Candidatus Lokiarchaeota archaeon]|nr:hypothetical protein [Candidatus Lokiarchaeota archaeon]